LSGHPFFSCIQARKDVGGRDKPGHDDLCKREFIGCI
jgi:hypothetical protein